MLPEPVAVALDVDDPAMVQQSVQDGTNDHRIPKELLPVSEALVGGDKGGASLISVRDELEEQIGLLAADRKIAYLAHHHQRACAILR